MGTSSASCTGVSSCKDATFDEQSRATCSGPDYYTANCAVRARLSTEQRVCSSHLFVTIHVFVSLWATEGTQ